MLIVSLPRKHFDKFGRVKKNIKFKKLFVYIYICYTEIIYMCVGMYVYISMCIHINKCIYI